MIKALCSPTLRLGFLAVLCTLSLLSCQSPTNATGHLRTLRLGTLNNRASFFTIHNEPAGFEYELARHYANTLGRELIIITAKNVHELLELLRHGQIDIAAAGLSVTPQRLREFQPGPTYRVVDEWLVKRHTSQVKHDPTGSAPHLLKASSHEEHLSTQQAAFHEYLGDTEGLLALLQEEQIQSAVVDSDGFGIHQHFYPDVRAVQKLSAGQEVAWLMKKHRQLSSHLMRAWQGGRQPTGNCHSTQLQDQVDCYFAQASTQDTIQKLQSKYFEPWDHFDYVDVKKFHRQVANTLPQYQPWFQEAAPDYLDWRLLAAIGYQESHWHPSAKSKTGVRGMMMLTQRTAKFVEVSNRLDPRQSIAGAARFIDHLYRQLDEIESQTDRLWLTLAAYNVGMGHLQDARALARQHGADPNTWHDVKLFLPRLQQSTWHSQTRYGYAPGRQAVEYVTRVQRYYQLLCDEPSTTTEWLIAAR